MEQTFRAQHREARQEGSMAALLRLWVETIRDVFTTAPREHLAIVRQDVGYALRALRRAPAFSAAAILTLAIGVSAVVAVFTIINAFMFRPLPVDRPRELVSISTRDRHAAVPHGLSFPDLQDYRIQNAVFTDLIGYVARTAALEAGAAADRITLEVVTDSYFSLLGVEPAIGRLIQPNEGRARGDAPVVVLTHEYWQSKFAGDPSIVGRRVRLNGRPFTIVGVTARTFTGTEGLIQVSAYVPLWMLDDLMNTADTSVLERRDRHLLTVLGRLKPGQSVAQARVALDVVAAALARQYPATNRDVSLHVVPETQARPNPGLGPIFRIGAAALTGLAGLLLLITSANVANLLMARAAGRGREVALRSALGARRGRLVRQLLTESIVLAAAGSVAAIPAVVLAMRALEQFIARMTSFATLRPDFSLDWRVVAATLGAAIVSGIVSGVAPACHVFRADLVSLLKTGGRNAPADTRGRLRAALVIAQVALSLALLVTGGLFGRSLDRARHTDLGFQPDGLLLATAAPNLQGYDAAQRLAFYGNAHDRLAAMPGVDLSAWISWAPFAIVDQTIDLFPEGQRPDPDGRVPNAYAASVGADYFATVGVPLVDGRAFDRRDDARAARVAIVNQTLAREFWPGQPAVGRRLRMGKDTVDVVGVARDGKYNNVWESPRKMVFRPLAQDVPAFATIAVRTSRPPLEMTAAIRQAIRAADPGVAVYDIRTMADHLDNGNAFFPFRLGAFVTGLFGVMGVLLASIGLYGTIAYHVSQRTQEIGVRMALGAQASDIVRDVLLRGGSLALTGIVIGVLIAGILAQLVKTLLVDVSPFDPVIYAAVAFLLFAVSLLASFVPARRATALDPLVALRAD